MEPVLELITSYENRISSVEELMTKAYDATVTSGGSFDILDEEREKLKTGLQNTLARNCSLRKKDFNLLIENVLSASNRNREAIEKERDRVRESVQEYLDEQKRLANCLRQQIVELAGDGLDKDHLDTIIGNIKATYEDRGQRLLAILKNFQLRLEAYQKEQEQINRTLQRLVDRGQALRLEDLRQLDAAGADRERKIDRELRREEVDRLLTHFRQRRLEIRRC
jgi:vacuolar-type H+-ATPase subunit H